MKIDLHIHTNASDGAWPAGKVVRAAVAAGLDVIAIADHDTTAAVAPAIAAAGTDVRVVPAVELTCEGPGGDLHLLGYGIDPEHAAIIEHARSIGLRRETRMRDMIELLDRLGAPVDFDAVLAEAGDDAVLGRPHLARALVAAGHVPSVAQAFDRYLGDAAPASVPVSGVSAEAAVAMVHEAGGLAVWAHPAPALLESGLDRLVGAGLDGIECFRPRLAPPQVRECRQVAERRGLLTTGGSDWHGPWSGRLGDFHVAEPSLGDFMTALG